MEQISLRDYFAAAALQGMLAADSAYSGPRWSGVGTSEDYQRGGGKWVDPSGVSRQAFEIADAMMAAQTFVAKKHRKHSPDPDAEKALREVLDMISGDINTPAEHSAAGMAFIKLGARQDLNLAYVFDKKKGDVENRKLLKETGETLIIAAAAPDWKPIKTSRRRKKNPPTQNPSTTRGE